MRDVLSLPHPQHFCPPGRGFSLSRRIWGLGAVLSAGGVAQRAPGLSLLKHLWRWQDQPRMSKWRQGLSMWHPNLQNRPRRSQPPGSPGDHDSQSKTRGGLPIASGPWERHRLPHNPRAGEGLPQNLNQAEFLVLSDKWGRVKPELLDLEIQKTMDCFLHYFLLQYWPRVHFTAHGAVKCVWPMLMFLSLHFT